MKISLSFCVTINDKKKDRFGGPFIRGNKMARFMNVPTSALRPGMIVGFHGGLFRLCDDFKAHQRNESVKKVGRDYLPNYDMQRPVFTITGEFVGGEPVRGYFGPGLPWRFQGNDLASWGVEVEPEAIAA